MPITVEQLLSLAEQSGNTELSGAIARLITEGAKLEQQPEILNLKGQQAETAQQYKLRMVEERGRQQLEALRIREESRQAELREKMRSLKEMAASKGDTALAQHLADMEKLQERTSQSLRVLQYKDEARQKELDAKQASEREALSRGLAEKNRLVARGQKLVGDTQRTGEFREIVEQLSSMPGADGPVEAKRLSDLNNLYVRRGAIKRVAAYEPQFRAVGATPPSVEDLSKHIASGGNPVRYLDDALKAAREAAVGQAEAQTHTAALKRIAAQQGLNPAQARQLVGEFGGLSEASKAEQLAEATAKAGSMRRGGAVKKVGAGAAGALLITFLANKMFGKSDGGGQIPPEMQMALMQQMAGKRSGGSEQDPSVGAGRELLNMSRALNLMKMLGEMQGMQAGAQASPIL